VSCTVGVGVGVCGGTAYAGYAVGDVDGTGYCVAVVHCVAGCACMYVVVVRIV